MRAVSSFLLLTRKEIMKSKRKDKLFENVKEAMTIKYIMYLMDKLYKEEKNN